MRGLVYGTSLSLYKLWLQIFVADLNEPGLPFLPVHGERRAAHEGDDDEGQDEDDVGDAAPRSQRPRPEPELLHDDAGNEDSDGRRNALAEAAGRPDGRRLLPEVVLEILRDEGEVANHSL